MAFIKSSNIKIFLISFFLAGIIYAGIMAGFRYYEGDPFSVWRFIYDAIFLGGFMGFVAVYERRNKSKNRY